jgi:hypothetical protein
MKLNQLPREIFTAIKEWLEPELGRIGKRLEDLEGRDIFAPAKEVEERVKSLLPVVDHEKIANDAAGIAANTVLKGMEDVVVAKVSEAVQDITKSIPTPQDGRDGRDALDLEVLSMIEEDRSYPRNTWATHKGGLWRSFQKTEGMRGWECVVNGFFGEPTYDVKDDGRTSEVRVEMSNGQELVKTIKFPGLLFKGVYTQSESYVQGDVVSCGGSMWYAKADEPGKPGADHDGWQLCVKHGRDRRSS